MGNKPCPFCEYQKLTEIFYYDKWKHIIVCRDKRSLKFKYRLLGVRIGVQHHKPLPLFEEREELLKLLIGVAEAHIKNGKAMGYSIDEIARSIPQHWHYQLNLT